MGDSQDVYAWDMPQETIEQCLEKSKVALRQNDREVVDSAYFKAVLLLVDRVAENKEPEENIRLALLIKNCFKE